MDNFYQGLKLARTRTDEMNENNRVIFVVTHSQITKLFLLHQKVKTSKKNKNVSFTKVIMTDSDDFVIDESEVYIDILNKRCEL